MALILTSFSPVPFRSVENITKFHFLFTASGGDIADGATSAEFAIPITARGRIVGIDFMSDSTNLNLSLRSKTGVVVIPSIYEIYNANAVLASTVRDLSILFSNDDAIADLINLYVIWFNNAGGGATGNLELTLFVETM